MSNYTKKAAIGAGIVFGMNILASLFSYLLRILLSRKLTLAEFGLVYAVFAFLGLVSFLRTLGLNTALAKFIAECKASNKYQEIRRYVLVALVISSTSSVFVAVIIYFLSNFLSIHFFNDPFAAILLRVSLISFLLSPIYMVVHALFVGLQKPLYFKTMDFMREVVIYGGTYVFLLFGFSTLSPVLGRIIALVILIAISVFLLVKKTPKFFQKDVELQQNQMQTISTEKQKSEPDKPYSNILRNLFIFGVPVILTSVLGKVFSQVDILLLTYFRSLVEVGLYNVALPTTKIIWRFGISLAPILIPLTAELAQKKKHGLLEKGVSVLYKYLYVMMLPLVIILVLFPKLVLTYLFGIEFVEAALALQILAAGALFIVFSKINFSVMMGLGKPKSVAKITFLGVVLNIIGNLILIPRIGIDGAAISTSISFMLIFIISFFHLRRLISFNLDWLKMSKITVGGVIFALTVIFLKNILNFQVWTEAIFVLIFSGILYGGVLFGLKVVTVAELKNIVKRIRK